MTSGEQCNGSTPPSTSMERKQKAQKALSSLAFTSRPALPGPQTFLTRQGKRNKGCTPSGSCIKPNYPRNCYLTSTAPPLRAFQPTGAIGISPTPLRDIFTGRLQQKASIIIKDPSISFFTTIFSRFFLDKRKVGDWFIISKHGWAN